MAAPVVATPASGSYFPLEVEGFGRELWRTDGTIDATFMLRDIGPGVSSGLGHVTNVVRTSSGLHFFVANDGQHGQELWVTDGTHAGTRMVIDLTAGPNWTFFEALAAVGDHLYFLAIAPDETTLWRTNGVDTVHVGPVGRAVFTEPRAPRPYAATTFGLFFPAFDRRSGVEPWRSDGTTAGTQRLADVLRGEAASWPHELTAAGSTVFFGARDRDGSFDLWRSDGTPRGTRLLRKGPFANLTAVRERAFFTTSETTGATVWRAAGDAVHMFGSIPDHAVSRALAVEGRLLLFAMSGEDQSSLWVTDEAGTSVARVASVPPPTAILPAVVTGPRAFFFADADDHASDLWVVSAAGATSLGRFAHGGEISVTDLVAGGDGVVFVVTDYPMRTVALWRSDGTPTGTLPLGTPLPVGGFGPASPEDPGPRPTPGCLEAAQGTLIIDERRPGHARIRARLGGFERFVGRQDLMGPLVERRVVTVRLFDEFERQLGSLSVITPPDRRCTGTVARRRQRQPCWSGAGLTARFRDPELRQGAMERLLLRGGRHARVTFVARHDREGGVPLGLPALVGDAATIEVKLDRGSCFRARITGRTMSGGKAYRATAGRRLRAGR